MHLPTVEGRYFKAASVWLVFTMENNGVIYITHYQSDVKKYTNIRIGEQVDDFGYVFLGFCFGVVQEIWSTAAEEKLRSTFSRILSKYIVQFSWAV